MLPCDFPNRLSIIKTDTVDSLLNEYPDVLVDALPLYPMKGTPMRIDLDYSKHIKPRKVENCCKLPLLWEEQANELVASLIRDDIIEEVHEETSDWVSPAFLCPNQTAKFEWSPISHN